MKRVLTVDVDEVLLDFIGEFNDWLTARGYPFDRNYMPSEWSGWHQIPRDEFFGLLELFINNHTHSLPPLGKAELLCRRARKAGWEVHLVTAHPSHLQLERMENLAKHGIEWSAFYATLFRNPDGSKSTVSKHDMAKVVAGDINLLVDDRAKTCLAWVSSGLPRPWAVTIGRSYNKDDLLAAAPGPLSQVRVVPATGSSNADAAAMHEEAWRMIQEFDLNGEPGMIEPLEAK